MVIPPARLGRMLSNGIGFPLLFGATSPLLASTVRILPTPALSNYKSAKSNSPKPALLLGDTTREGMKT
jgi:hypothetical protein